VRRLNASTYFSRVFSTTSSGSDGTGGRWRIARKVAEDLVMNPNTVVRAYRELEHEGVLELKHGSGAFIKESAEGRARLIRKAQAVMESAVERLLLLGLTEDELRRAFENELAQANAKRRLVRGTEEKP